MKNNLVENITKKISAVRFWNWMNRINGKPDPWLKVQKEVLHIKKHIVWLEDIIDKELTPPNIKGSDGFMTANPKFNPPKQ